MAVSQGCGLLRRTFCCFTNSYLPYSRIRIATFSLKTYSPFVTTQKRFCSSQDGADADQAKTSGPSNLLEVYKNEPSLLDGPRNALKPLTEEHIEKERRKSRKVRLRTPVKIDPDKVGWTTGSQRVGTIGVKLGMSALISRHHGGKDHKTELQVGAVDENDLYKVKKSQFGHFRKHGMNPKKKELAFMQLTTILANMLKFKESHRGFQGVMKRWKMKGQPQSHGQTKTHRKMGASGGGTNPGRIFPGKRMAGHMGNKNCTKFAVRVLRINTNYNVLYIHGECPGKKGGFIVINDAWKKHSHPPPFPTYFPDPKNPLPEDLYADNIQQFEETIYFSKERKTGTA
ncbi:39S ribosomal protein L3 [Acropora cervicornis]|uniref:Large ribosomal subunit protein uL3m n=1 Tax=Acropora cervicornis TaxID=6130 RepID=A0AAD9QG61_ACRCE|nr:39S ribosomal protein L3 [Acropora cervicornis]